MTSKSGTCPEIAEAIQAAQLGTFVWNIDEGVLTWSDGLCRIHGIDPGAFEGTFTAFLGFQHPDDLEAVKTALLAEFERPGPFVFDHRIVRPDGEVRTLHAQGLVEAGPGGRSRRVLGTCWDVTKPASDQRALARSLSLLQATLDATADGILVVDREQRVVAYNRQFLKMWRIPAEVAERRDDAELLRLVREQLADPEGFMQKVALLYETPNARSKDVIAFKDGRTFERVSKPQRLGDEITGRVWSFSDVTSREKALAARELFLATAAHEIRGPLTSLRLVVDALRGEEVPQDEWSRLLSIAERETTRLSRFVDQLLDLGSLRAEQLELAIENVDLAALVETTLDRMQHEIVTSGSTICLHPEAKPVARADTARLGQVLSNLLLNAIKFGEGKPIDITIGERDEWATIEVRDEGAGMQPEELDTIFEPFERLVSTRHYGGLGLGLHIVQSLVAAMGGTVAVTSDPGRGSTFTLELPKEAS